VPLKRLSIVTPAHFPLKCFEYSESLPRKLILPAIGAKKRLIHGRRAFAAQLCNPGGMRNPTEVLN